MANCCAYKVIVKGRKNACYAFFGSMSAMDYKDISLEEGTDECCILHFDGNCKWHVDCYCKPWLGDTPVALPEDAEDAYQKAEEDYWYHTVQDRSRMFAVEVWCNSADIEDYVDKPNEIFEHYICGVPAGGVCPDELRIGADAEEAGDGFDPHSYPIWRPIEGTGYAGRNDRIEFVQVGDELILKADYDSPYYSPAVEVFNAKGETLGYLKEDAFDHPLSELAEHIDQLGARVAEVTPLSQRSKRAKYALMTVEVYVK